MKHSYGFKLAILTILAVMAYTVAPAQAESRVYQGLAIDNGNARDTRGNIYLSPGNGTARQQPGYIDPVRPVPQKPVPAVSSPQPLPDTVNNQARAALAQKQAERLEKMRQMQQETQERFARAQAGNTAENDKAPGASQPATVPLQQRFSAGADKIAFLRAYRERRAAEMAEEQRDFESRLQDIRASRQVSRPVSGNQGLMIRER